MVAESAWELPPLPDWVLEAVLESPLLEWLFDVTPETALPPFPPLPLLPPVVLEEFEALPVRPVEPVLPELPEVDPEFAFASPNGDTATALELLPPVDPELPELPEFPLVAVLADEAFPPLPELPPLPLVALDESCDDALLLPLFPPWVFDVALLSPPRPEVVSPPLAGELLA